VTEDRDSSGKNVDRQSQLASYLLNGGESVEVAATERYGAAHHKRRYTNPSEFL
jgi:hypothetical protein